MDEFLEGMDLDDLSAEEELLKRIAEEKHVVSLIRLLHFPIQMDE